MVHEVVVVLDFWADSYQEWIQPPGIAVIQNFGYNARRIERTLFPGIEVQVPSEAGVGDDVTRWQIARQAIREPYRALWEELVKLREWALARVRAPAIACDT